MADRKVYTSPLSISDKMEILYGIVSDKDSFNQTDITNLVGSSFTFQEGEYQLKGLDTHIYKLTSDTLYVKNQNPDSIVYNHIIYMTPYRGNPTLFDIVDETSGSAGAFDNINSAYESFKVSSESSSVNDFISLVDDNTFLTAWNSEPEAPESDTEEFITLNQLKEYDKLKAPAVIYVDELPANPENSVYGITHQEVVTKEISTKMTDILSTYFRSYQTNKWTLKDENQYVAINGTQFKSAYWTGTIYYLYVNPNCSGMIATPYNAYTDYNFSVKETVSHKDYYAGNKTDVEYKQLATKELTDDTYVPIANKGKANGVASLDSNGRVPVEQMPVQAFVYLGEWDASKGVYPPDADTPGDFYVVSVAGTIEDTEFLVGDWIVWNGAKWNKSENKNYVTSVNKKRGEVQVYGDNTEIETPDDAGTKDTRTIKKYIDDITVDGNTWTTDTQDIVSKAVYEVDALPTTVEDKVYITKPKLDTSITGQISFTSGTLEENEDALMAWLNANVKGKYKKSLNSDYYTKITNIYKTKVALPGYENWANGFFGYNDDKAKAVELGFSLKADGSANTLNRIAEMIYVGEFTAYAKDLKLLSDREWSNEKGLIAYKNKENTFTETNTFSSIKTDSIGKDNTEITFDTDDIEITGDVTLDKIKNDTSIEITTQKLTQNGKYIVTEVDGVDTTDEGKVTSKAVLDKDELPTTVEDKVYRVDDKVYAKDTELVTAEKFKEAVKSVNSVTPDENGDVTIDHIMSKATYLALCEAGKDDPNANYFITDEASAAQWINDLAVSTSLTWSSSKIRDAITAATPVVFDNDSVSTSMGWTSSKIQSEINSKTSIDDTSTSTTNTWSSNKTNSEISTATSDMATQTWVGNQGYLPKDDTTPQTDKVWSSNKTNDVITTATSDMATQTWANDNFQPKGSYLTASDISDMETKSNAANTYQPKGSYATSSDISDMATKTWVGNQGYTKNTGTVTGIKVNGSTKTPTSGTVDIGDVVTSLPTNMITEDNFKTELQKYIYKSGSDIVFNL